MPSVCPYSDREIALSLLTLSLRLAGHCCACVCECACVLAPVCVSEKVSDSLIMSFCGPPLCALQSSPAGDRSTRHNRGLDGGFPSALIAFNRPVELANVTRWLVFFFFFPSFPGVLQTFGSGPPVSLLARGRLSSQLCLVPSTCGFVLSSFIKQKTRRKKKLVLKSEIWPRLPVSVSISLSQRYSVALECY